MTLELHFEVTKKFLSIKFKIFSIYYFINSPNIPYERIDYHSFFRYLSEGGVSERELQVFH